MLQQAKYKRQLYLTDLKHSLQHSICSLVLRKSTHSFIQCMGAASQSELYTTSVHAKSACEVHESQSSTHVGHIVQDINNVQVSEPPLGPLSFFALYKVPGDLPDPPPLRMPHPLK